MTVTWRDVTDRSSSFHFFPVCIGRAWFTVTKKCENGQVYESHGPERAGRQIFFVDNVKVTFASCFNRLCVVFYTFLLLFSLLAVKNG